MVRTLIATGIVVLSGAVGVGYAGAAEVNPQPLPPKQLSWVMVNPQPLPPAQLNWVTVNPQPLPPRVLTLPVR